MKCEYCNDPIYGFQKVVTSPDREGKQKRHHKGCHEIMMDGLQNGPLDTISSEELNCDLGEIG